MIIVVEGQQQRWNNRPKQAAFEAMGEPPAQPFHGPDADGEAVLAFPRDTGIAYRQLR